MIVEKRNVVLFRRELSKYFSYALGFVGSPRCHLLLDCLYRCIARSDTEAHRPELAPIVFGKYSVFHPKKVSHSYVQVSTSYQTGVAFPTKETPATRFLTFYLSPNCTANSLLLFGHTVDFGRKKKPHSAEMLPLPKPKLPNPRLPAH